MNRVTLTLELDLLETIKAVPPVRAMHRVVLVTMVIIMDVVPVRQILKRKQPVIYSPVPHVLACVLLIITVTMDLVQRVQMDMKMLLVIHNSVQRVLVQLSHRAWQVNMEMEMDVQHVHLIPCQKTRVTHKTVQYAHVSVWQITMVTMEHVPHVQRVTYVLKVIS